MGSEADEISPLHRVEHELRMKNLFLAVVSHELRGLIAGMIRWLDIGRTDAGDPAKLNRALDFALRSAKQQKRIVEDLLDVSRIVSGKLSIEPRSLNLGEVAREATEAWRPAAAEKRLELRCVVREPVCVEGDAERLCQVIGNLLGNAIKFNRPGGWVEMKVDRDGTQARLVVADNGAGIPRHHVSRLFEPLWQGDPAAGRRSAGLGLGLPLVHSIVKLHGGCVSIESGGPRKGTRCTVWLPAG